MKALVILLVMPMLINKVNKKITIVLAIVLISSIIYLFNGFKSEMYLTIVKRRYSPSSFPEYITYKTNKGLFSYRGDMKFNPDSVRKDETNTYYAEYSGYVKNKGIKFLK
ncbi:hypothetical protein [Peptoniphilus raoultii]|uniref:hypothetical protein n=1 Tax=Peptoniphilus raoultii TaxID=1776387 RepID=UPI00142FC3F5|nr:hypothetical protein [Peptoniphilus raoultii]